tara:strand:+ start:992 stop:1252 length:261 start_codon:yes stop_codon:yes gene_type:complete
MALVETTLRARIQELLDEAEESDAETLATSSDRSDEFSEATDSSFIDDDDYEYVPNTDDDEPSVICGVTLDGHGVVMDQNGFLSIE